MLSRPSAPSGGFAFARSGDVVAVSGPDGASIIQTGDVNAGTNGTNPAEPSPDGGNNNVDDFVRAKALLLRRPIAAWLLRGTRRAGAVSLREAPLVDTSRFQ